MLYFNSHIQRLMSHLTSFVVCCAIFVCVVVVVVVVVVVFRLFSFTFPFSSDTIRVSNNLYPDQVRHFVEPDPCQTFLQRH